MRETLEPAALLRKVIGLLENSHEIIILAQPLEYCTRVRYAWFLPCHFEYAAVVIEAYRLWVLVPKKTHILLQYLCHANIGLCDLLWGN